MAPPNAEDSESPLSPKRLNRQRTQVLLDWDDSILPTSFLAHRRLRVDVDVSTLDATVRKELEDLDRAAVAMLNKALDLARHVTIVTNAEDEWIEQSSATFLPGVRAMLDKVEVCSARSKHENTHPSIEHWKRVEFQRRAESLSSFGSSIFSSSTLSSSTLELSPQSSSTGVDDVIDEMDAQLQLISIGDSEYERAALWSVKQTRPDILVKSVKLLNAPTIVALRQQLNTVTSSLESIVKSTESLDLKLHVGKAATNGTSL